MFFLIDGFKKHAEGIEQSMNSGASDIAKLAYLEVLDLSFSIDGVLGAFAFTTNVALILIGNGIGALVVREMTIRGVEKVGQYRWLKNGAMTSIGVLGILMLAGSFGLHPPEWLPTLGHGAHHRYYMVAIQSGTPTYDSSRSGNSLDASCRGTSARRERTLALLTCMSKLHPITERTWTVLPCPRSSPALQNR